MNIFILDERPNFAALYHCDKHVNKMIVESAQMLCTAHRMLVTSDGRKRWIDDCGLYKSAYENHPCTRWARETSGNYYWLCRLFKCLLHQYGVRYDGKYHSCSRLINRLEVKPENIPDTGFERTPFAQAMPDKYKHKDAVYAYREYYWHEKFRIAQWRFGDTPDWWQNREAHYAGH